jgi:hypothetical protein
MGGIVLHLTGIVKEKMLPKTPSMIKKQKRIKNLKKVFTLQKGLCTMTSTLRQEAETH